MIGLILIVSITPVIMILCGKLLNKKTPKSINYAYGYRTKRSMMNQETWDFSNKYSGELFFKTGLILLVISIVCIIILNFISEEVSGRTITIITYIQLVLLFAPIVQTEIMLRKKFDENGIMKK